MSIFFRSFNRHVTDNAARRTKHPRRRVLAFEPLEDRRLLAHAPLNFTVTNTGGAGLRLEWTDNGATGYEIQSSVNGLNDEANPIAWKTGLWRTTKTVPAGFGNITLERFRSYYFRIQALPATDPPHWSTIEYTTAPPEDNVVKVSAVAITSPSVKIKLQWPEELKFAAATYTISRKAKNDLVFVEQASNQSGNEWEDSNVTAGKAYEYEVKRFSPNGNGTGYVYAGIDFALGDDDSTIESPGTVILVVDNTQAAAFADELDRLEDDLIAEGWKVDRFGDVAPHDDADPQSAANLLTMDTLRSDIQAAYTAQGADVKAVFLIGHVPIPMSGWNNPDGHGPRPMAADVYYGDMDGVWTDVTDYCLATALCGPRAPEINAPNEAGDGIFDQKEVPAAPDGNRRVELMVGRVDMRNLTFFSTYDEKLNETALLKRYLDKDHAFRTGLRPLRRAGIRSWAAVSWGISA